jgi:membrane protease YdiL (CAAX protease family)
VPAVIDAYRRGLPYIGLLGLAAAVVLRVQIAGPAGAQSHTAAVWFAAALGAVALATQGRPPADGTRVPVRAVGAGLAGALVLCVPAAIRHATVGTPAISGNGYATWAVFVVVVAVAEEALLRGSLFRAIQTRAGTAVAIGATSIAFGLLHAPVYGWAVVPLDIAVGVWLGTLRAVTGTVAAPAIAHSLADLAGWWLR